VGGDAQPVADRRDRREHVERAARHEARHAVNLVQACDEELDLLLELLHLGVTIAKLVAHCGDAGHLRERWNARQRAVRELAEHVDDLGAADREAEPPPAHAERFAECVRRDGLFQHTGQFEERVMAPTPYHAVVRLVAEHRDVPAADQIGQPLQIFKRGNAAGRVMGAVEENPAR
jgi:hypothetical protein